MRIVNRQEFLQLPAGTVYAKYESLGNFGDLCVKEESVENDWYYYNFISADVEDSEKWLQVYLAAEANSSVDIPYEPDTLNRDGGFDEKQQFLVFGAEELKRMVLFLQSFCNFKDVRQN